MGMRGIREAPGHNQATHVLGWSAIRTLEADGWWTKPSRHSEWETRQPSMELRLNLGRRKIRPRRKPNRKKTILLPPTRVRTFCCTVASTLRHLAGNTRHPGRWTGTPEHVLSIGARNQTANKKQTISLVEKVGNGEWKPTGDPSKGVAHDQISPEAKTFNQHWFVDKKQVQLVVGKDSNGNLIKACEVQVVINKLGDRPVYSPVP